MNLIATSYAYRRFVQFGRKYAKSCAVNGERLSCEKPQAVDQSNSFRQFDESFDPRAAHVSLSSKSLRRRSRREFATQSSPRWRARSPLVARHQRCRKFCYAEVSLRRGRNSYMALSFCQAFSLRLHAQRKSGRTLLCNFYLIRLLSTT